MEKNIRTMLGHTVSVLLRCVNFFRNRNKKCRGRLAVSAKNHQRRIGGQHSRGMLRCSIRLILHRVKQFFKIYRIRQAICYASWFLSRDQNPTIQAERPNTGLVPFFNHAATRSCPVVRRLVAAGGRRPRHRGRTPDPGPVRSDGFRQSAAWPRIRRANPWWSR